jgi:hypothetical protein
MTLKLRDGGCPGDYRCQNCDERIEKGEPCHDLGGYRYLCPSCAFPAQSSWF